ncbi:MAG: hypothetical protein AAF743_13665, partial [Planctomycetota bacterium]
FVGGWLVFLIIRLLRAALRPIHPIVSVARLTVDEALRSYVVVIFTAVLLALLCSLPLLLSDAQPLRYQIQSYLTYGHVIASVVLGLMTVLFSCWNVARDMEQQRAFDVFSKPISRGGYLLGKFAGVAVLNIALVAVVVAVMWYIPRVMYGSEASIRERTRIDGRTDLYDAFAVRSQVLTARGTTSANPPVDFAEEAERQLQAYQAERPEEFADFVRQAGGTGAAFTQAVNTIRNDWLQVAPGDGESYVFTGLGRLKALADAAIENDTPVPTLQLRYHVEIPALDRSTPIDLTVVIDNEPMAIRALVDQKQVYEIPATFIADDGTLTATFFNFTVLPNGQRVVATGNRPRTVKFAPEEGLQVLYEVGDFGPNVVKAGLVMWLRLAFLSALGTVCGAVFSFAVAAILALTVTVLAAGGDTIASVVASGSAETGITAVDAAYTGLLGFAATIATGLRTFSRLDAGGNLADGQVILLGDLTETILWVSVAWTGVALLIGWALFSRRELARVQV